MGIVGAILVTIWAIGLIRDTAKVLLDAEMDEPVVAQVRQVLNQQFDGVLTDLHVSRVAQDQYACIIAFASREPVTPDAIKKAFSNHDELVHITVEINPLR